MAFLSRVLSDEEFAERKLSLVPPAFRQYAARMHQEKYKQNPRQANLYLLELEEFIQRQGIRDLSPTDDAMSLRARELAQHPLTGRGLNEKQMRRRLRSKYRQGTEMLAYKLGIVGSTGQQYASELTISGRRQQKNRWEKFAATTHLRQGGKQILLADVMQKSTKCLEAERYHWVTAIEQLAEEEGMMWSMWTWTAPPEFHPNPTVGKGTWNDELTPRDAHKYIHNISKLIRANLPRGVKLIGIRITECHKDGCPHWHVALFYRPENADIIRKEIRRHWPDEAGAQEVVGDKRRGSFAGYMFKYMTKGFSWSGLDDPDAAPEPQEEAESRAARAVDAWRSAWGIRSFQFLGLPVGQTVWRALREQDKVPVGDEGIIDQLWLAARATNATKFIRLAGGLGAKRRFELKTIKNDEQEKQKAILDKETGEIVVLEPSEKWEIAAGCADMTMALSTLIHSVPRNPNPTPPRRRSHRIGGKIIYMACETGGRKTALSYVSGSTLPPGIQNEAQKEPSRPAGADSGEGRRPAAGTAPPSRPQAGGGPGEEFDLERSTFQFPHSKKIGACPKKPYRRC